MKINAKKTRFVYASTTSGSVFLRADGDSDGLHELDVGEFEDPDAGEAPRGGDTRTGSSGRCSAGGDGGSNGTEFVALGLEVFTLIRELLGCSRGNRAFGEGCWD